MATGGTDEENRAYLFRLQIILIDGGLLLLRNILDQRLIAKGITLGVCLNNEKATITRLSTRGIITPVQYDTLFPTTGRVPTTSDLDITLIICLLRNLKCVGLNKTFDWNTTPLSTDKSLEADIWLLKNHRNKICHISTTTGLQQNEFTSSWNDIEQILVRQSPPVLNIKQKIAEFQTTPLDLEEEKKIQKQIENWQSYEDRLERLENRVERLEHADFGVSKQSVEEKYQELKNRE